MATTRGDESLVPDTPQGQSLHWFKQHLPADRVLWPGVHDVEPVAQYVQTRRWAWCGRRLYFFSDLHADTDAFLLSLIAAGGILKTGASDSEFDLTEDGGRALFIIGGDCFDKGPHNLRLLEVIRTLHLKGAQVELLAGNHDVRTFIGMRHAENQEPLVAHLFARLGKKTVPFLKEIYDGFCEGQADDERYDEAELDALLFPNASWFEEFPTLVADRMSAKQLRSELVRMEQKIREFRERSQSIGLDIQQVYCAVKKFRELFFEPGGRYHWFYESMKLAHREGSYLFVHGGMDDTVAAMIDDFGVDHLNSEFIRVLNEDPFELYHGELGNVMRTKYRDTDYPFTTKGASLLHNAGIAAIVHGHRSILDGQRVILREDMLNIECDASVDRNSREERALEGLGGAAVVFTESGEINGISTDYPSIKSFHPPTEIAEGRTDAD